jgi:type II secretory ATPase GspE/PulE/Tfp pilus assembly ATPase PilB-like protein
MSTLHATDSISAVLRLTELGVDRTVIASALIGVIAQRLVRTNCKACAEPDFPRPIYLQRLGIPESQQSRLRASKGCGSCKFNGTQGRTGLYELLEVTGSLREKVLVGNEFDIRTAAKNKGFVPITQQVVDLVLAGDVSVHEAYRTCYFGGE